MVAFIAHALYNGLALAWYDAQVLIHRVRQFRPVCVLLGHTFPDLTVCTRPHCTTRFDRVRDGARPR
jgi:hypothetical protein